MLALASPIPGFNARYVALADLEPLSQTLMRPIRGADEMNIFDAQLSIPMGRVDGHSILARSVFHIVPASTKKNMFWIYAKAVVARVAKNCFALWQLPLDQKVGNAVRPMRATLEPEKPVAVRARMAGPVPATVLSLFNKGHEAVYRLYVFGCVLFQSPRLPRSLVMLSTKATTYGDVATNRTNHPTLRYANYDGIAKLIAERKV